MWVGLEMYMLIYIQDKVKCIGVEQKEYFKCWGSVSIIRSRFQTFGG